jgi:predicted ribosomally synthesized peptide with nif11-like leader
MKLEEFVKKLADDPTLVDKLNKAANPEEAFEICKAAGLDETFEAFSEGMSKLAKAQTEMSAEEVDAVVGGSTTTEVTALVTSTAGAAASAGAAAAV